MNDKSGDSGQSSSAPSHDDRKKSRAPIVFGVVGTVCLISAVLLMALSASHLAPWPEWAEGIQIFAHLNAAGQIEGHVFHNGMPAKAATVYGVVALKDSNRTDRTEISTGPIDAWANGSFVLPKHGSRADPANNMARDSTRELPDPGQIAAVSVRATASEHSWYTNWYFTVGPNNGCLAASAASSI